MKLRRPKLPTAKPVASNVRTVRYKQDATFRERERQRSREAYRKRTGKELTSCLRSLSFIDSLAESVPVRLTARKNKITTLPVLSVKEAADCLDSKYSTVWRWIQKDMLPEPVLEIVSRGVAVYHLEEVRIFVEEIGKHYQMFAQYRYSNSDVREVIFARTDAIRAKLKLKP